MVHCCFSRPSDPFAVSTTLPISLACKSVQLKPCWGQGGAQRLMGEPSTWIYLEAGKIVSGGQFLPREHLAMSRDIFWGKGTTGLWAEARDVAKHPTMLRTAPYPTSKNDPAPNINSAKVEKLGIGDTVGRNSGRGLGRVKERVFLLGSY